MFIVLQRSTKETQHSGSNWRSFQSLQTLEGPWQLTFDTKNGGPAQTQTFAILQDWSRHTEPGIRNYSGTAVYTKTFNWQSAADQQKQLWIDLGEVANIATVTLNGKPCGIAWTPPYRVEITHALRSGVNELRIEVTNTWANRLIGDHDLPEQQRITRTVAPYRLEGKPLLPAGLLGPVRINCKL